MQLTSSSISDGKFIDDSYAFNQMGCNGENISPELEWKDAPASTQSFVVTAHDPDAKSTGHGWWHWTVVNIPPEVTKLEEGASHNIPKGAQELRTDFRQYGYGGPCPPKGDQAHRYVFTVYALRYKLEVDANTTAEMIKDKLERECLDKAQITALYARH